MKKNEHHRFSRALVVFSLLLLGGCATSGRHIDDPTNSLVFAYVDMEDAPTGIDYAQLHQVVPKTDDGYWTMGSEDDLIFNQYLPNGAYQLAKLAGSHWLNGEYYYNFPSYGRNETAVEIGEPGIYFLGAYRYEEVDTGFFEAGKFKINRVQTPTEREVLEKVATMDWIEGTQWAERIRERLAELPQ